MLDAEHEMATETSNPCPSNMSQVPMTTTGPHTAKANGWRSIQEARNHIASDKAATHGTDSKPPRNTPSPPPEMLNPAVVPIVPHTPVTHRPTK